MIPAAVGKSVWNVGVEPPQSKAEPGQVSLQAEDRGSAPRSEGMGGQEGPAPLLSEASGTGKTRNINPGWIC